MTLHSMRFGTGVSFASRLETVTSVSGIEACFLEDHTHPIVAVTFGFEGGGALDPKGKAGAARMLGGLLTEGAGSLSGHEFRLALADEAIQISFEVRRDRLVGTMTTLSRSVERAFELLGLALREPLFEEDEVRRRRMSFAADLRRAQGQTEEVASDVFFERAFRGHTYGQTEGGKLQDLDNITRDDLFTLHKQMISRQTLSVAVVGAVTKEALSHLLDTAFAGIGDGAPVAITPVEIEGLGEQILTPVETPQSTIYFGRPAIATNAADFPAAMIINHCLGGSAFTSRLFNEIRDRRGLCYSIWTHLDFSKGVSSLLGATSTPNEKVGEVAVLIGQEITRLLDGGLSDVEIEAAQSYLIGSYVLRMDTSMAIAKTLLAVKMDGFGTSWLDERNKKLAATTPTDVHSAFGRLLGDGKILMSIAGG